MTLGSFGSSYHHRHQHLIGHGNANSIYRCVGLFNMVGCSIALWLLALITIVLVAAIYSNNPFAVHPIVVFTQSYTPTKELLYDGGEGDGRRRYCHLTGGGRWVRETSGLPPLYTSQSCRTMPESKNCAKYGKDMDYVNWRWTPDGCELPRFDAKRFLTIVRGKTMAFIGDSVSRNQYESLLCLLSQEEPPREVYRDADDRFRIWNFPSHNFTVKALWTRFFVEAKEHLSNGTNTGVFSVYVDKIDPAWSQQQLHDIDISVVSGAHWFFRKLYLYDGVEGNNLLGCVFCSEPNVSTITVASAIKRVIKTTLDFVKECQGCKDGLFTILRTFSPAHFEGGSWDSGGYCNRTQPKPANSWTADSSLEIGNAQVEEVDRVKREKKATGEEKRRIRSFEALQVTWPMLDRGDGHPGKHWNNEWMKGYSDCVHWCLPGPIDTWNELLLEILARKTDM